MPPEVFGVSRAHCVINPLACPSVGPNLCALAKLHNGRFQGFENVLLPQGRW